MSASRRTLGGSRSARLKRYLAGLLAHVERKNGWQIAEVIGEEGPQGVQRLLNASVGDADDVRDDLRASVIEHLGDTGSGLLIIDETGFPKKVDASCGVAPQYCGAAGATTSCQTPRGRPRHDHRSVLGGMLWVLQTASPWREMPARFGTWDTAYAWYHLWVGQGLWQRIIDALGPAGPPNLTPNTDTGATCCGQSLQTAQAPSRHRRLTPPRLYAVGPYQN